MKKYTKQTRDDNKKWYIVNAEGKVLGRVASTVASVIRGKEKATFSYEANNGDYVIIINADKIKVTGNKENNKIYRHHTNYPGGLKETTFDKKIARHPTFPLEAAIKGMLPQTSLGRRLFKNVKIYAGEKHPHTGVNPVELKI